MKITCSVMKIVGPFLLIILLAGCSTTPKVRPDAPPPLREYGEFAQEGETYPIQVSDPLEGFNRGVYRFNYYLDKYLLLPVVGGYQFVMPDYVEDRVSNFFDNIGEIGNFTNSLLQFKMTKAGVTGTRFVLNSTLGILGFWDVAGYWGVRRQNEDFGQTLGYYGVGHGPFLVLPLFGPSNLRDTTGLVVDSLVEGYIDPMNFDHNEWLEIPYYGLLAVDTRKRVPFRYYGTGNPFEYELVRMLYTKKRELEIAD